jgi:hypothetical protein
LPERTDKRDSISVAASVTGFILEFVDGVKGDNVSPKAMPKVLICSFLIRMKLELMKTELGPKS